MTYVKILLTSGPESAIIKQRTETIVSSYETILFTIQVIELHVGATENQGVRVLKDSRAPFVSVYSLSISV